MVQTIPNQKAAAQNAHTKRIYEFIIADECENATRQSSDNEKVRF